VQANDLARMLGVDETRWLLDEDDLLDLSIEECGLYVHVVYRTSQLRCTTITSKSLTDSRRAIGAKASSKSIPSVRSLSPQATLCVSPHLRRASSCTPTLGRLLGGPMGDLPGVRISLVVYG
jgi:hypothetical protein